MRQPAAALLQSLAGVSETMPELERDIDAQLRCLADPDHPKRAVFLAKGNDIRKQTVARGLFIETRPEGTLVTDDATMAQFFRLVDPLTDEHLAALLGYPEPKADVMLGDGGMVVQAVDRDGCIIFEAAASGSRLEETIVAANAQTPPGGRVNISTIQDALARRISRMH